MALARLLGPEGRGAYATCLIFSTTLSLIFVLAFDFEAIYFVSSGQMSLSEGIFYSSIVAGAGSILAAIVGFSMLCHSTLFVAKAPSEAFLSFSLYVVDNDYRPGVDKSSNICEGI